MYITFIHLTDINWNASLGIGTEHWVSQEYF